MRDAERWRELFLMFYQGEVEWVEPRELAVDLDYLNGVVVLALDLEAVAALNDLQVETVRTAALINAMKEARQ